MSARGSERFWIDSSNGRIYGSTPEEAINNARKRIVAARNACKIDEFGWEHCTDPWYGKVAGPQYPEPLILPISKIEHWLDLPQQPITEPLTPEEIQALYHEEHGTTLTPPAKKTFFTWLRKFFK